MFSYGFFFFWTDIEAFELCSWSYIYKKKYYLLLDHIVYLEKEASQAHKCFLGPSVGIWKIILLGGRELKGEYRCPVNQDIKKKGEAVMWQWLVGENLANSREKIGRYDNLGNVCIIYKSRLILSISCSTLAWSVFNLPLAGWGCAIDHTLCVNRYKSDLGRDNRIWFLFRKALMLNRLVKLKETNGLRLSSKLEQWELPSEGADEESCSVSCWSAGHWALTPQKNSPKLQSLTGLQQSQRKGFDFLDFSLAFLLFILRGCKSRCFLH